MTNVFSELKIVLFFAFSRVCQQGFEDALRFLQKRYLISCTRCLNISSTYTVGSIKRRHSKYALSVKIFVPFLKTNRGNGQVRIDSGVNKDDIEEQTFLPDRNKIRLLKWGVHFFRKWPKQQGLHCKIFFCQIKRKHIFLRTAYYLQRYEKTMFRF
jgi:hypothetical protein